MNLVAASPLFATSTEWMGRSPPSSATRASSAAASSAVRLGTPSRVEELRGSLGMRVNQLGTLSGSSTHVEEGAHSCTTWQRAAAGQQGTAGSGAQPTAGGAGKYGQEGKEALLPWENAQHELARLNAVRFVAQQRLAADKGSRERPTDPPVRPRRLPACTSSIRPPCMHPPAQVTVGHGQQGAGGGAGQRAAVAATLGERPHGRGAAVGGSAAAVAIRRTGAIGLQRAIAGLWLHWGRRLRHGSPGQRLGASGQAAGAPSGRWGVAALRLCC